ncbi:MAG: hypothetical protein FWG43_05850 [Clostridiales bacterium]|nr:hypothetical protein [Clostridiales bacterium]
MRRGFWLGLSLGAFFVVVMAIYASRPAPTNMPYSSNSTASNGTKAAFLLLDDVGFQVKRKTGPDIAEAGVIIAFGAEYLPESAKRVNIENSYRYTNANIRTYAYDLVETMWPYRDNIIYFDEYKRSVTPYREKAQAVREGDLLSIMPLWLKMALLNILIILFFSMFFYKQRLGEPQRPREFAVRNPLEGVYAMAGAMWKAKVYKDCILLYYGYHGSKTTQWDRENRLFEAASAISNEKEAVLVLVNIDNRIKEWRNDNKRVSG